jgi:hypothetical protein
MQRAIVLDECGEVGDGEERFDLGRLDPLGASRLGGGEPGREPLAQAPLGTPRASERTQAGTAAAGGAVRAGAVLHIGEG